MENPAGRHLKEKVIELLKSESASSGAAKILNAGAGKSTFVENSVRKEFGEKFICDRMDVTDCYVKSPIVGKCFITTVESMPEIKSNAYEIVFANHVIEHITDLKMAASEIARVLKPSGYFVVSLSNPSAPEFIISKHTSTKFHQLIKGRGEGNRAFETFYAYKDVREFVSIFERHFLVIEIKYWPNTLGYLYRFPIIRTVSRVYDKIIKFLNIKLLMGSLCVVFKKTHD